jgi:hypothetical protein
MAAKDLKKVCPLLQQHDDRANFLAWEADHLLIKEEFSRV